MGLEETILEIKLQSVIELAIEYWRLNNYIKTNDEYGNKPVLRHVVRKFEVFFEQQEIKIVDLTGRQYDPGMAVDIIFSINSSDTKNNQFVIDETVKPIIIWNGNVIQRGEVVIKNIN